MKAVITALLMTASLVFAQEINENENTWKELQTKYKTSNPSKSPEALVLYEKIIAEDDISMTESIIVAEVAKVISDDGYGQIYRQLANSSKTGDGIDRIKASLKYWDGDTTGWTDAMIRARLDSAIQLASNAPEINEFSRNVWIVMSERPALSFHAKRFFKKFRATLTKEEQIVITTKQKNMLISLSNRTPEVNAWLAEISADLIALQLD